MDEINNKLFTLLGVFICCLGLYEIFGKMLWNYEQSRRFRGFDYTIILTLFTMVLMIGGIILIEIYKECEQ